MITYIVYENSFRALQMNDRSFRFLMAASSFFVVDKWCESEKKN